MARGGFQLAMAKTLPYLCVMKPLIIIYFIVFSFMISCKKNSDSPPKIPNDNLMTGTVTVNDRAPRNFVSTGDSTSFTWTYDDVRGDTLYAVTGYDGVGSIALVLVNKYQPGTYEFIANDTNGNNISYANYIESIGYSYTLYLSTVGTDTANNALATGAFTIDKLTDSEIEGSMNMVFTNGVKQIGRIEDLHFKASAAK